MAEIVHVDYLDIQARIHCTHGHFSQLQMVTTVNYGLDCYYSALEAGLSLKSTIGDRRTPQMVTTVNYRWSLQSTMGWTVTTVH